MTIPCFKLIDGRYVKDPPDPKLNEPEETPEERERKNALLKTYPYNLALRIFDHEEKALRILPGAVDEIMNTTLTEQEAHVLRMRFNDEITQKSCGEILGITSSRVGQIEAKALRKMRHPSRTEVLLGESKTKEPDPKGMKIEELGLRSQAFSALKRAEINYVEQIECMTKDNLSKVRGLGRKSVDEIMWAMENRGMRLRDTEKKLKHSHLFINVLEFEKLFYPFYHRGFGEEDTREFSPEKWGRERGYFGFSVNPWNEDYFKISISISIPHQTRNLRIYTDINISRKSNEASFSFDFPYKKVTEEQVVLTVNFVIDFINMLKEHGYLLDESKSV